MECKLHTLLVKRSIKYTMNSERFLRKTQAALPILALITFWLPVIAPLAQRGVMTCSHDGVLHWLRAFQLDELARQGIVWPRWAAR